MILGAQTIAHWLSQDSPMLNSLLSYLSFYVSFFFFGRRESCLEAGEISSWPTIKPVPPATEAWSLNYWTAREVTVNSFLLIFVFEGITPVLLFTELRVGKAWVGKLEENSRRRRNCRHVYSLQDGAIARHAIFSLGGPSRHSHKGFSGGAYIGHDAHVQCYKWSQLLHNHAKLLFTKCGVRARGHGGTALSNSMKLSHAM